MADKTNEEKVAEYRHAITMAVVAARAMATVDVPTLLEAMRYADSFGPLLDPTLWRNKQKAMQEDLKLLEAALPLHRFGKMLEAKFPFNPTSGPQGVQGSDDDGCPV